METGKDKQRENFGELDGDDMDPHCWRWPRPSWRFGLAVAICDLALPTTLAPSVGTYAGKRCPFLFDSHPFPCPLGLIPS